MQGFNRYVPPDFDPKKASTLNAHQGKKHALGKRAKDIDKGILVVRFELPFNIWCGTCNAHIGAGVRYNAQKKKVGNYYSTPIFGFRCKCHLCSGWFEIRTDPKNAAYEVFEGARKKDEDWNPEEEGGYAVHDTEAPSAADAPVDPFAHIEKTIDQQTWAKTKSSRLSELQESADRLSSDPYVVSSALRRRFREEKKVLLEKQARDDGVKARFGLAEDVDLGEEAVELARERWEAGRERKGLPVDEPLSAEMSVRAFAGTPAGRAAGSASTSRTEGQDLGKALRRSTARKYDPFGDAMDELFASGSKVRLKGRIKDPGVVESVAASVKAKEQTAAAAVAAAPTTPTTGGLGGGLLAGYESD